MDKTKLAIVFFIAITLIPSAFAVNILPIQFNVDADHRMVDILGTAEPQTQVFLEIWDSSGNLLEERIMTVDFDGDFRFQLGMKYLSGYGDYTGKLTYEGQEYNFTFSMEEKKDPTLQLSDAQTIESVSDYDQNIEMLQLEINKKDNRIMELENQVYDLKKEIENLNKIIQEQIKVIMDVLVSLKT